MCSVLGCNNFYGSWVGCFVPPTKVVEWRKKEKVKIKPKSTIAIAIGVEMVSGFLFDIIWDDNVPYKVGLDQWGKVLGSSLATSLLSHKVDLR
eukprot:CAMPEP_0194676666 /NCGR_PEP_ID=MMETSP0295-20121207/9023_1 /TAXON_ID=39354 /ORGANISM="Heterosigma akashiwo, Strain CCMP2393" /LENGTH=92 /DNA_ID=CAMNT_0039561303 /DNA_START=390 /DNA_END=664 /DNA_ORIENTATION=-